MSEPKRIWEVKSPAEAIRCMTIELIESVPTRWFEGDRRPPFPIRADGRGTRGADPGRLLRSVLIELRNLADHLDKKEAENRALLMEADSHLSLWLHRYPSGDEGLERDLRSLVTRIRRAADKHQGES